MGAEQANPPTISNQEIAQARSHTYTLLSELYLRGLQAEHLAYIQAIPDLNAAFPPSKSPDAIPFNPDEAAADHYALFGLNVFPFESVFLEPEIRLGGLITEHVQAFYHAAGFDLTVGAESADHVGMELGFLAYLCGLEAGAWGAVEAAKAAQARSLQCRFLDEHLLRWLPGLAQAIRQQDNTFFTSLADLSLEVTLEHRASLVEPAWPPSTHFKLPMPPDLAKQPQTGLSDIAAYLLTPVFSGIFLSQEEITTLARAHNLPRGFGDRQQMLVNLFRSAAEYADLSPLLSDISAVVLNWQQVYQGLLSHAKTPESVRLIARIWLERLAATLRLLEALQRMSLKNGPQV